MMTRSLYWFFGLAILSVSAACAEGTPTARSANDEDEGSGAKKSHDDPDWYDQGSSDTAADKKTSTNDKKKPNPDNGAVPEPTFKEGMSVNDAMNAIPQGTAFISIDQDDLDRPLMQTDFYKPCKVAHTQHFTIKFAVWDGHAVGIDVKTQPENKALDTCLRGLVAGYTWKDKVKALNISTVSF
jgi:hypothetical protein